jgi:hypothetical protein
MSAASGGGVGGGGGSQVDRMLGKSVAPAARPDGKELGFVSEAGGTPRMIDFVQRNGDRTALPYAYLVSVKLEGGQSVELSFTESVVTIAGRGLAVLYQHLLAQTARVIEESGTGFDDDRQRCWVQTVSVKKRKG